MRFLAIKEPLMNFSLIFSLFFSIMLSVAAIAQPLNRVVAVVNNSVITQSELNEATFKAKQSLAASNNPNAIDNTKLQQQVLQNLINEKLILSLAKQAHIQVSDDQVNAAIERIAAGNHLTISQLKQALQQHGLTYEGYSKMIHNQMLMHQVEQAAIGAKVTVTPATMAAAKKQLASMAGAQQQYHVLDNVSSTKTTAEQNMLAMKQGKTVSSTNDLGWQAANTLPNLFLTQLKNMSAGDIVGPLKAPNGYHVIKLVGVRGPQLTDAQLKNIAYQMEFQKAADAWLQKMRKTAYIKILTP